MAPLHAVGEKDRSLDVVPSFQPIQGSYGVIDILIQEQIEVWQVIPVVHLDRMQIVRERLVDCRDIGHQPVVLELEVRNVPVAANQETVQRSIRNDGDSEGTTRPCFSRMVRLASRRTASRRWLTIRVGIRHSSMTRAM